LRNFWPPMSLSSAHRCTTSAFPASSRHGSTASRSPARPFSYTEKGPEGLAGGKHVIIASSRGGHYSGGPAAAMDFQESYLRAVFGFLGITELEFVRAEGLNISDEHKATAIASAKASIGTIGVPVAKAA
jgi:FMN-dependent NADH-azoreductase